MFQHNVQDIIRVARLVVRTCYICTGIHHLETPIVTPCIVHHMYNCMEVPKMVLRYLGTEGCT